MEEFALTKQGLTSGFPQPPSPSHGPLPPRRASTAATRARSIVPFIIAMMKQRLVCRRTRWIGTKQPSPGLSALSAAGRGESRLSAESDRPVDPGSEYSPYLEEY